MTTYSYSETPPVPPTPSSQQRPFQLPRSLTSPEAWISVILALLLQYNQLRRSRRRASYQRGKFIPSNKSNNNAIPSKNGNENKNEKVSKAAEKAARANERNQERQRQKQGQQLPFSLIHSWLFTGLLAMTSPYSSMASDLNAKMVDLKNEEELNKYTREAVGGASVEQLVGEKKEKGKKKNATAAAGKSHNNNGQTMMEIRTRRITPGEMVYQHFFDSVESLLDLCLALLVGLASRWIFGLFRSLGLSSSGGTISPMSLSGGPCCSPYRGGDDAGTKLAGSFEKLLACVLIKGEGDEAGTFFFSLLWILVFGRVLRLGWMVSIPDMAKVTGDGDDNDEDDEEKEKQKELAKTKEGSKTKHDSKPRGMKRVHPLKAKRFFVGAAAALASLWLFHTPVLMRKLGLAGFSEAAEEWSARVILFANLVGLVSITPSEDDALQLNDAPQPSVQFLVNIFFIFIAFTWGYVASGMMIPIQETARNAAFVLSPPPAKGENKNKSASSEMFDLINTRIMLIIQALIPFFILCTYLFAERLSNPRGRSRSSPHASGGVPATQSFSKQHLQHDGLYIRVVLAWCFLLAVMFTFRSLLQSFLDQASNVASAMAALGEGSAGSTSSRGGGSEKSKSNANANSTPKKVDPFSDRYKKVVLTAGRIAVFPTFIFSLIALAHFRGGIGSQHPGVDHISKPKNAPREIIPAKGLIPPYTGKYMVWMANKDFSSNEHETSLSGQSLLQAASMSHTSWEVTPFRDAAHRKVVDWAGRRRFCNPPEDRSVKALRRHVNFLLESIEVDDEGQPIDGYSVLTINAMTGRELLDMAPILPMTLMDSIFGRNKADATCNADDGESAGYCKDSGDDTQLPTFWDILDSISSHHILTPTVVFSVVDTMAFLGCAWWVYWYSVMMVVYWIQLKKTSALRITG